MAPVAPATQTLAWVTAHSSPLRCVLRLHCGRDADGEAGTIAFKMKVLLSHIQSTLRVISGRFYNDWFLIVYIDA